MTDFARRLPVYLLLDCSGSMSGEPIEAVKEGIRSLVTDLKSDPQALETAYLSVITFNSKAEQVMPLTELMQFEDPEIQARGATALGSALRLLRECIEREVRKSTAEQKGDWKPLVFMLTDGVPTDEWEEERLCCAGRARPILSRARRVRTPIPRFFGRSLKTSW